MATAKHYIDNKEFLKQLLEYFEECKVAKTAGAPEPPIPNYIGECFFKIATNLSRMPNFVNYSFRDEMIMDGVENCLMYFRNFDPSKSSNPFSYFTQITYFAFIRRIGKEKKQSYIKYKLTEQQGIMDEMEQADSYASDDGGGPTRNPQELYDNMAEYIHDFEEKVEEKKKKRQKAKAKVKELPDTNKK
jgi:hypothetical protein